VTDEAPVIAASEHLGWKGQKETERAEAREER
jgi:hypothetical protein